MSVLAVGSVLNRCHPHVIPPSLGRPSSHVWSRSRGEEMFSLKPRKRFIIRKIGFGFVTIISLTGAVLGIFSAFTTEQYRIEVARNLNVDIDYKYALPVGQLIIFLMALSGLLYIAYISNRRLRRLSALGADVAHLARAKTDIFDGLLSDPAQSLNEHLRNYLGIVQQMFSKYTRAECAVCVKMLLPKHTPPYVKTLVRDTRSMYKRRYLDKKYKSYPYTECTVFKEIFRNESNIFLCNNLSKTNFESAHKDWKKLYNAVLATSISDHEQASLDNTIGFLCVDNLVGNFDEGFCENILIACANDISQLFRVHYQVAASKPTREV